MVKVRSRSRSRYDHDQGTITVTLFTKCHGTRAKNETFTVYVISPSLKREATSIKCHGLRQQLKRQHYSVFSNKDLINV